MKKPDVIKKTIKDFIPIVVKERKKKKISLQNFYCQDLGNLNVYLMIYEDL